MSNFVRLAAAALRAGMSPVETRAMQDSARRGCRIFHGELAALASRSISMINRQRAVVAQEEEAVKRNLGKALWACGAKGAALVVIGALLAACGGGGTGSVVPAAATGGSGGGSTSPITPPTPPTPPTNAYALQTSVPAASYAAGSAELAIYSSLNEVRAAGGWGLLAQSTSLDKAAQFHAQYLLTNRQLSHTQTAGLPGFTGVTVTDRTTAAGYSGSAGEVIGGFASSQPVAGFVFGMLNSIYHAQILQGGSRDVGVGLALDSQFNQTIVVVVFGVGTGKSEQLMAAGAFKTYPTADATGVMKWFPITSEVPRPLPELSSAGHPIAVLLDNVTEATSPSALTVDTFTLKDANGNLVPALLMTAPSGVTVASVLAADRRTDALVGPRSLYLVPKSPLLARTKYTAQVSVRSASVTYARTWSFTTGD